MIHAFYAIMQHWCSNLSPDRKPPESYMKPGSEIDLPHDARLLLPHCNSISHFGKSFFTFGNSCFACLPRLINPCYTNESWKQNVTFCLQIGTFGLKTNSRMKQPTKRSNTYSVTFSLAFRCRLIISACTCPAQHILRKRKERNQKSEISIPRRQMKVLLMQGLS